MFFLCISFLVFFFGPLAAWFNLKLGSFVLSSSTRCGLGQAVFRLKANECVVWPKVSRCYSLLLLLWLLLWQHEEGGGRMGREAGEAIGDGWGVLCFLGCCWQLWSNNLVWWWVYPHTQTNTHIHIHAQLALQIKLKSFHSIFYFGGFVLHFVSNKKKNFETSVWSCDVSVLCVFDFWYLKLVCHKPFFVLVVVVVVVVHYQPRIRNFLTELCLEVVNKLKLY